jgi:signal transduction histidine kinase
VTLTNRLTLFFLVTLGVVLAAFSGTTYVLARTYLIRQLNDRATATLDTLVAAAEVEDDGLEWEPKDRRIQLRGDGEPPIWAVYDQNGQRLGGSDDPARPLEGYAEAGPDAEQSRVNVTWDGDHWRVVRRTLRHPRPETVRTTQARPRYRTLVFVSAWPVAPVHELLRTLAWSLGGVSLALWVVAGLGSRWVCRRALAPVSRMTEAAKGITADDLGERLPVPAARDELHDLATRFNELLARLQDSFERQRRFTGEASHQLRTPLTAMLGQMEVALRRERDPDEYRRVLTSAVAQAGRLRGIVESLLFLARADAEARHPDLEPVNLAPWLHDHLTEAWSGHPRFADLCVEVPPGEPVTVYALPALLGQAVDNLLDNAFKYSDPGSPVSVVIARQEDGIVFVVEDRGSGIDAEDAGRVFEPFYRSAEVRRAGIGGVGLGLAIAARIVTAFGGRIEVKGRPGGGSRLVVRFPRLNSGSTG